MGLLKGLFGPSKKEREQAEREARYEEHKRIYEEKKAAFIAVVNAIPRADVGLSGEKGKVRNQNDIQDEKYTNITAKTNVFNLEDFVVIDTETTGLKKTDGIVAVAAIRFEAWEPVEAFYTLVNPEKPIPPEASAVNGLHDEDVASSPTIWQIMPSIQSFVSELPIVGHNLPFDLGYLYRYGFELGSNKRYDTLQLSRRAISKRDTDGYTLSDCCIHYSIPVYNTHNALADAYLTGKLFQKLSSDLCAGR